MLLDRGNSSGERLGFVRCRSVVIQEHYRQLVLIKTGGTMGSCQNVSVVYQSPAAEEPVIIEQSYHPGILVYTSLHTTNNLCVFVGQAAF